jgi:hypothetical protein
MNETTKITPAHIRILAAQAAFMVRTGAMPSLQEFYDVIGEMRSKYRLKIVTAHRQQHRDPNQLEFGFAKSLVDVHVHLEWQEQ